MDSLMNNDSGSTVADLHTKRYYRNHGGFLWIDRHGIDHRADTLLTYLQKVDEMGFKTKHFYVNQITQDLEKLHSLNLGEGNEDINHVMARLEYRLTKSYFFNKSLQGFFQFASLCEILAVEIYMKNL